MGEPQDPAAAAEEVRRLAAEFLDRYRRGDWPRMDEYLRRYPHLEAGIREVFPSLLQGERLGAGGNAPRAAVEGGPEPSSPSRRIGPYDTLVLLGSGGQGDVWLAEDSRLARRVALKVLPRDRAFGGRALERFRREAAITARLEHPGICPVYEAGEDGGVPWIAMRYVEGETLADWTATSRGETVETPDPGFPRVSSEVTRSVGDVRGREGMMRMVEIVEKSARALHAAHEAGLVHRDIKPGNIIVTPALEPVLLDFGLAREESDDSALTLTGTLMGTPAYMSPEQLTAQRIHLDRRTDVYSLGVTLYECLTLRLPFEAPTREQLYQRILVSDPEDARRHNPRISPDLRVVLETALEKDRNRRYQTALDFAEDLRRVRANEPIRARPAGPLLRLRRWAQRNPATAGAAGCLVLSLTAGLAVSLHLLSETRTERDAKEAARAEADGQRSAAERARDETARALRRARALGLASASFEAEQTDPILSLHLAAAAGEIELLPPVVERLHGALAAAREFAVLPHDGEVLAIAWSPGGDRLATASRDGKVRLWDASGRASGVLEGHGGPVLDVAFSESGDRLLSASADGTARLWTSGGRTLAVLRGHGKGVVAVALLPGGGWATASEDGTVRLWSDGGEEGPTLDGGGERVTAMAVAPGGGALAAGSADGSVRIWDRGGRPLASFREEVDGPNGIGALVFSPDGERLLVGTRPLALLRDLSGNLLATLEGHVNFIRDAAFSPDGKSIATHCTEGSVGLWTGEGKPVRKLSVPPQALGTIEFSPDGTLLMACGADNALHLWDAEGEEVAVLRGHRGSLLAARFSREGDRIASASRDGTARLWRLHPGEVASVPPIWPGEVIRVALSGDGRKAAVCSWSRAEGRVFDLEGRPLSDLRGHTGIIRSLAFSRGGDAVLTGSADGTARVWDPATGNQRLEVRAGATVWAVGWVPGKEDFFTLDDGGALRFWGSDGRPRATIRFKEGRSLPRIAFTAAGDLVAGGEVDGSVHVFRTDGTLLAEWTLDPRTTVMAIAFAPTGDRLFTGSFLGLGTLSDLRGVPVARFEGHGHALKDALFSEDGRILLTSSADLTARLWNPDGSERAVLRGHLAELRSAGFLPPGDRVLTTSSSDGSARVWDLEGRLLHVLRIPGNRMRTALPIPGGDRLLCHHEDNSLRVWTLDPEELLRIARGRSGVRPIGDDDRRRYAELLGE